MTWHMVLAFLLGAVFGSFANVLIHRLPRMIMAESDAQPNAPRFDVCWPASHCPHCNTPLRWWHNLPLLSFALLKGRCGFCHHPIAWRYWVVECVTGLVWAICAWHWGFNATAACWAGFATVLLTLSVIDARTTLLPDALTQPLLWGGLIASAAGWLVLPLQQSVWGAVIGYASLWAVATAFERVTGKQGMGAGDFKLLAALGAWLGPLALLPVLMLASLSGALVGLGLKFAHRLGEDGYVPFGPFLALAGCVVAVVEIDTIALWMGWSVY